MHPVSILTFGIFFAGYITARWDLVTRLYELAIFAWDHGVIVCRNTTTLKDTLMAKTCLDTRRQRLCRLVHPLPAIPHPHPAHRSARIRAGQSATTYIHSLYWDRV